MAALTAALNSVTSRVRIGDLLRIPMAADAVCYIGGMVCRDADGYAMAAADTTGYVFAGVAVEDPQSPTAAQNGCYDNTGGDDGDMEVVVMCSGRARFDCYETPAQDMLFCKAYVADDQTVAIGAWNVTNDIRCGHVVRLPATTLALHADEQFGTDQVEIEFSGEPADWHGGTTTTAGQA